MMIRFTKLLLAGICGCCCIQAPTPSGALAADGGIRWAVKNSVIHMDHLEMSGEQLSGIIT